MRDLAQLIIEINKRHHEAEEAASASVLAGITCGEALIEARAQVPTGGWPDWCEANLDFGWRHAGQYMRVAYYKEVVAGAKHFTAARRMISGLPPISPRTPEPPPALVKRARALQAEGLTYAAISRELDTDASTVQRWLDPAYHKRQVESHRQRMRKRRADALAAQREQRREEREQAIREAGGKIDSAYALLRRYLLALDAAIGCCEDPTTRAGFLQALRYGHRSEDAIAEALKGKDFAKATRRHPSDPV